VPGKIVKGEAMIAIQYCTQTDALGQLAGCWEQQNGRFWFRRLFELNHTRNDTFVVLLQQVA
jgi:hypothetical protein